MLRNYQQKIIEKTQEFFKNGGKHAIVSAPTGAGKTMIFSYIADKVSKNKKKVLVFTDRTELLSQASESFGRFGVKPILIQAGSKYLNTEANCYIAMSQTFKKRIDKPIFANFLKKVDLIIIDECHKQEFNYLFESGLIDKTLVLGFTATPTRGGKMRQLGLDYEKIITEVSVQDLINHDFLVVDEYFGINSANVENLPFNALNGDFDEKEQFKRFNSPKLYAGAYKEWEKIAKGTQTLVFCVNIEHCIKTCEEFQKNGVNAKFLVSSMSLPKKPTNEDTEGKWVAYEEKMRLYNLYQTSFGKWSGERSTIIKKFKKNEFTVLINAGILTTGFDAPNVTTILTLRATSSVSLWMQIIGRGSRKNGFNKTHFNILDFGDNAKRLGHYSQNRAFSLWHSDKIGDGIPPVKECGLHNGVLIKSDNQSMKIVKGEGNNTGCKRLIMASYKICPFCGFVYPDKKIKEIELVSSYLDKESKVIKYVKKTSEMNDDELHDYYKSKGHKPAWLWRQLYFRGGEKKINDFGLKMKWSQETIKKAISYLKQIN